LIISESNLPSGAGISSSAAFACGLLSILFKFYKLDLPKKEFAYKAMKIEHQFVGTNCG